MSAFEALETSDDIASIAERLRDPDAGVRRIAVPAQAETADPGAIPYLATALSDAEVSVRRQAATSLGDGRAVAEALAPGSGDALPGNSALTRHQE